MERGCSREDLLDRWREIEEEEEDEEEEGLTSSKDKMLRRMKEQWFSDTFKFLMHLPEETHLWCGFFDLMGPLLETFHNYFNDKRTDSPLRTIWKRASRELNQCTQCVCQLHQAQETYSAEYEYETVGPLLKVLQCLDEERIADHLEDMNARIRQKLYDREGHAAEVVSILFEVLMFPTLLDDQLLVTKFESFIEAIDKSHELSLAGNQQYPGVYALLFLRNSKARAIGLRLAGGMGKLRSATDLEPLQPLLKKYIIILETDMLQSDLDTSRPRVRTERSTVWLGFKALLGFLESPAFEEGILERHPIFLSIVLNHVSDDTPDFSSAVTCLRLFFEMLGCKLWLRTTISPSVMRNTLLGQCFHTANEKSHKEIFDLFPPFLQSLEALQDGEHEKQRRHFLYFLLQQVTHSSNFSELMRKNGCKIALCIIQRGYKMNPPCPPFECSHAWGPSLVSCLKNLSLHKSLRQPALDLIQTIIVSDCAALASLQLNLSSVSSTANTCISPELYDDEDETPLFHDIKENDSSCWTDFRFQSKLASQVHKDWRCIPMLWHDVFVGSHPSILPMSFFKAVVWGISHLPMLDSDISVDHKLSVSDWLSTYAGEISESFMWEVPQGYDDGTDGKESKSSLNASFVYIPLIRTFKRFAMQYITTMGALELHKQLTWEPRISESLILLLINPNDTVRHANKIILEHLSNTRGLTSGLQFLFTNVVSLYATYTGLKYAANQVQGNHLLSTFHSLHHLFFVVRKILKEVVVGNTTEKTDRTVLLSEGGFLRYPCNLTPQVISPGSSSVTMDAKLCINFSFFLSASMWPSILKCLSVGEKFIDSKNCQMTCVRLLELLPVVFEWLITYPPHLLPSSRTIIYGISDLRWLFDLVDWGKSSLTVVIRHWKQSLLSIIGLLTGFHDVNKGIFHAMEQIMSFDAVALDELKGKVSQVTLSLSKEATHTADCESKKPLSSLSKLFYSEGIVDDIASSYGNKDASLTAAENVNNRENDTFIILSDEEDENAQTRSPIPSPGFDKVIVQGQDQAYVDESTLASDKDVHQESVAVHVPEDTVDHNLISKVIGDGVIFHQEATENKGAKMPSHSCGRSVSLVKSISKHGKQDLKISHGGTGMSIPKPDVALRNTLGKLDRHKSTDRVLPSRKIIANKPDALIKESVSVADNPLDLATFAARHSSTLPSKFCVSVPKRKVVHLEMPTSNRPGHLSKYSGYNRHRPPKLDEWYKPILELDYFSLIGLSSDKKDNVAPTSLLKEVPLCFHSPEHYVEIFRPLVLEEFKAQIHNSCLEVSSSDMFCSILCVHSVERIDDFHLIRGSVECDSSSSVEYLENDLVLLTKDPLKNFVQPLHALGKVERRERNNKIKSTILSVKVYLQSGLPRLVKVKKFLIERSKWHISRIMSITPQLREFQALSSLNDIPLLPLILSPNSSSYAETRKSSLDKLPEPLQRILKSSFNESQLQAIGIAIGTQGSIKAFELSLIQGPPGTGKTRTIVAIVSALLASKIVPSRMLIDNSMSHGAAFINPRARVSQITAVARAWQDAALAKQIDKDEVREYSESRLSKGRILICAQSNAAVDELVSRISSGIYGNDGKIYKPFLVRVGNIKTVHPSSLPFFIDTLVEQRLAENKSQSDTKRDVDVGTIMSFRVKLEKIVESIQLLESKRAKLRDADMENKSSLENSLSKSNDAKENSDAEIGAKLKVLYAQKKTLCGDIATAQTKERKLFEESKILKNKIRRSIIREAEVVVSTLSGCGGDIYGVCSEYGSGKFGSFSEHSLFDAVVIDEAAQALEPATLIPLQLLKSTGIKCVMVGDPKQLPATVLSNVASKYLYECSMFERLQRAGHPVIMLMEQYRMHPEICKFPSSHFYEDALVNGVSKSRMSALFHGDFFLQPYLFFDIIDGRESQGKSYGSLSLYNGAEAEAAIEILKFFRNRYPSEFSAGRIGVITPYKSQLSVLRSRCNSEFGASVTADIEFKTVDGFQGREVDILLLSTVRASDPCVKKSAATSSRIGFVADVRRMNVALTRAKFSLWIVGNERTLLTDIHWFALLKDAKERNLFRSLSRPYKSCLERSRPSKKADCQSNLHSLAKHSKYDTHEGSRSENLHASNTKELNRRVKPKDGDAGKQTPKNSVDGSKKPKILPYKTPHNHHIQEIQKSSTSAQESELVKNLTSGHRGSQSKKSFPHDRDALGGTIKYNQDAVSPLDNEFVRNPGATSEKYTNTSEVQSSRLKIKPDKDLTKGVPSGGEVPKESHTTSKKEKSVPELEDISLGNMNILEPHVPEACIDRHFQEEVRHRHLTSARKRQREAVDSLLSSSLLSSTKSEVSLRSALLKKPLSQPASESDATRRVRSGKANRNKTKRLDEE